MAIDFKSYTAIKRIIKFQFWDSTVKIENTNQEIVHHSSKFHPK